MELPLASATKLVAKLSAVIAITATTDNENLVFLGFKLDSQQLHIATNQLLA